MRRALALALLVAAVAVPAARADGDPASDVLLSQDVFFPFGLQLPQASQAGLKDTVRSARAGGYPIRVAIIPRRRDLGIVTPLWQKPQPYAHFLAQELAFVYRGRLLTVMPNGYGIYWCTGKGQGPCAASKPVGLEKKVLAGLPPPQATGKDIAAAADAAVRRLAAARGIDLKAVPPPKATANGDSNGDRLRIAAGALAVAALGFAVWIGWRLKKG